jgi:hypothetical protein
MTPDPFTVTIIMIVTAGILYGLYDSYGNPPEAPQ